MFIHLFKKNKIRIGTKNLLFPMIFCLLFYCNLAFAQVIGASQYVASAKNDVNYRAYTLAELPDTYYAGRAGCLQYAQSGTLNNQPYVVVFIGNHGNFRDDSGVVSQTERNAYYEGVMTRMAGVLTGLNRCVRVLVVETNSLGYFGYQNYNFFGANMSGTSYAYMPMSKGASAEFAITLSVQQNLKYKPAVRWYLHGQSAGAMNAARLVDMLNSGAAAAYSYKVPEAVVLESLPMSGDMAATCANAEPGSLVAGRIAKFYADADACKNLKLNANPRVLSANIVNWYLYAQNKKIYIMMGADDPVWKNNSITSGWTALGVYKNFLATIGVPVSACASSAYAFDASHERYIYNRDMWASCLGGKIEIRQFYYGNHGPIANSAITFPYPNNYHQYGSAEDHVRTWLY